MVHWQSRWGNTDRAKAEWGQSIWIRFTFLAPGTISYHFLGQTVPGGSVSLVSHLRWLWQVSCSFLLPEESAEALRTESPPQIMHMVTGSAWHQNHTWVPAKHSSQAWSLLPFRVLVILLPTICSHAWEQELKNKVRHRGGGAGGQWGQKLFSHPCEEGGYSP